MMCGPVVYLLLIRIGLQHEIGSLQINMFLLNAHLVALFDNQKIFISKISTSDISKRYMFT